jgi:Ran GTPase-activating protein 1
VYRSFVVYKAFVVSFAKNLGVVNCSNKNNEVNPASSNFPKIRQRPNKNMSNPGETEVSIAGQGIQLRDEEDIAPLIELLRKRPSCSVLTLTGNSLAPAAGKALSKAIIELDLKQIAVLNFSDLFTGRVRAEIPPTLTSIFDALIKVGCKLTTIDLSDNAFGPDGAKPCVPLLKSEACLHSLKVLKFNNNGLGRGGVVIAKALEQACILTHSKFPLEVFVAGRNRLEDPGAKALAKAIVHMKSLKEFAIAQNGIRKNGIKALSKGVAGCSSLQILNLNDNTFTSFGAIPMARALSNLPDLEVIEFGDCLIRNRGCEALTTVLEENKFKHLKKVNVYAGEIKSKWALKLVEVLSNKEQDIIVDLDGNNIGQSMIQKQLFEFDHIEFDNEEFEDDDGTPENSDDSEEEDDDDDGTDDDEERAAAEEIEANNFVREIAEPCTAEEFLQNPTGGKLLFLGEDCCEKLLENMKVESYRDYLDLYLKITKCITDSAHTRTMEVLTATSDDLFKKAFEKVGRKNSSFIVNYILARIGLLKDEEVKHSQVEQRCLRGILLSLQHCVGMKYFPRECSVILKCILDKPPMGADHLKKFHNDKAQLAGVLYRIVQVQ